MNKRLLLNILILGFILTSVNNILAQPMSGDYTVGLNLFRELSKTNIVFEKRMDYLIIEDFTEESYLKAERGEVSTEQMEKISKIIEREVYIPYLDELIYDGSLYYEFTEDDKVKYNLSSRGVYATIGAAAADINSRGVSGPVRFLLVDVTYTSESFPIVFNTITGASSTNTISIMPATGVTASITGSINLPLIELNGCSYFIIDGRQEGTGTTKSLTITNNSTASNSCGVKHINGSSFNIIRYVNFVGMSSTSTTRLIEYNTSATNPDGNSNNLVEHCDLNSSRYGIYFIGTIGSPNSNNVITNNKIYNTTFSHFFFSSNTNSTTITNNEIYHITPQLPAGNNSVMQVNASNGGTNNIKFNKIYDVQTNTVQMRGIYLIGAAEGSVWNIENNFISLTVDNASKTTLDAISIAGSAAYTVNIYYNTIRIGGNNSTGGTAGNVVSSGLFKNTSSVDAVLNMKNNIFYNSRTGGNAGVVHAGVNINNLNGAINIDYNNYFSSGVNVRYSGTDYTDLSTYKTAVAPNDQNTIFKEVFFVSNTDLHLSGSSNGDVDLGGTPIAGITVDIDGDIKSETYPYMGADEAPIPIPVELTSFTANVSGNNILLNWTTASETNNLGFYVERNIASSNQNNWEQIAFVEGNGTTTEIQNYSFRDNNLLTGKYSYRLKQTDFDGGYEYSNAIEVEIGLPEKFELLQNYPNPFNPSTEIRYQIAEDGKVSLIVYDILGNKVTTLVNEIKSAGSYNIKFEAGGLSSGIYYYKLTADEFVQTKKMILMK